MPHKETSPTKKNDKDIQKFMIIEQFMLEKTLRIIKSNSNQTILP